MCLCCSFSFGSLNPSSILFCSVLCFGRLTSLHVLHPDSLISDFQWDSVNGKLPEGKRRKRSNIDPSSSNLPTWLRFGHWQCLSLTIALFNLLFFCLQSLDRVTSFTWFGLSDPMLIQHLAIESSLSCFSILYEFLKLCPHFCENLFLMTFLINSLAIPFRDHHQLVLISE